MSEKKGLTLFIVDDNAMSLRTLADDLRLREDVKEVYTFSNYTDATLPLIEIQPDALFLVLEHIVHLRHIRCIEIREIERR